MPEKIPENRKALIHTFVDRNSQINLSAIREPEDIYIKHILDSIELTKVFDLNEINIKNPRLLDLGTGGGFPLLPLAITYPHLQCIGLDARKKKCHAIDQMVKALELENVLTARSRAEEYEEQADIVTSRAVTYADKLMHRALPLVKPKGYFIMYKLFTLEEDNTILSLIRQHKLTLVKLHHYHLPDDETERVIYILQK